MLSVLLNIYFVISIRPALFYFEVVYEFFHRVETHTVITKKCFQKRAQNKLLIYSTSCVRIQQRFEKVIVMLACYFKRIKYHVANILKKIDVRHSLSVKDFLCITTIQTYRGSRLRERKSCLYTLCLRQSVTKFVYVHVYGILNLFTIS